MNVILKGKLAGDEEELIMLAVEVIEIDAEDGGDVVPDVVDSDDLHVLVQQCRGLLEQHG